MASNKEATLKIKNNAGSYTPLYPILPKSQVIGWDAGEIVGPYTLELKATDWVRNIQTLDLNGVSAEDVVHCVKVLEGTEEQMLAQYEAYQRLNPRTGVQSLSNQIKFTCDEIPQANFKVLVWWTK